MYQFLAIVAVLAVTSLFFLTQGVVSTSDQIQRMRFE